MNAEKVAIIGVGVIGRSWAAAFIRAGFDVSIYDASASVRQCALAQIEQLTDGIGIDPSFTRAHVRVFEDLGAAVEGASAVQESVVEDVKVRRALYEQLSSLVEADAIIGSSSSAIPGSAFLEGLPIAPQAMVVHPTNPPHLVPLTELCPTPWTTQDVVERWMQTCRRIGQVPVLIRKEVPGFVLNRLQVAVVMEAMSLVERNVIDPIDLDAVMKFGLALRWAFMGPFETGHLNADGGFAEYMTKYRSSFENTFDDLDQTFRISDEIVERVDAALRQAIPQTVRERQSWRDHILVEMRQRTLQKTPGVLK